RTEVIVGQLRDVVLDAYFGDRVRRDRAQLRGLVDERVARLPVAAARRRVEKACHAGVLGQTREPDGRGVVDVEGDVRVEVAQRIVRERAEVNNRVESVEMTHLHVAQVEPQLVDVLDAGAERALTEEITVEPDDFVASAEEHRYHHGADVALVSGDQNSHLLLHSKAATAATSPRFSTVYHFSHVAIMDSKSHLLAVSILPGAQIQLIGMLRRHPWCAWHPAAEPARPPRRTITS